MNYQYDHCRETFGLVRILKDHGCTFTERAEKCDVFVPYVSLRADGTERECKKLRVVREAIAAGKKVEIIDFGTMLDALGAEEADLEKNSIMQRTAR